MDASYMMARRTRAHEVESGVELIDLTSESEGEGEAAVEAGIDHCGPPRPLAESIHQARTYDRTGVGGRRRYRRLAKPTPAPAPLKTSEEE